jgi:predicted dehydrogenase
MIRVGLLGFGLWGSVIARNLRAHPEVTLAVVGDPDAARRALAARDHPEARVVARDADLLTDGTLDGAVIATPAGSHFPLALRALAAGLHVWVEKPLATRVEDAERLVEEAARRGRVLLVDHTYLFAPEFSRLADLVDRGDLGTLTYYDSTRIAQGRVRSDVNVAWDLAVHDLALLDRLLRQESPEVISAHPAGRLADGGAALAFITLRYPSGLLAHLHVSWVAPFKQRRILLGGDRRTVLWDDLAPQEKLRIFDTPPWGAGVSDAGRDLPCNDACEPLALAVADLVRAIKAGRRPTSDGESGLRVVRLLDAIDRSLRQGGAPVKPATTGAALVPATKE